MLGWLEGLSNRVLRFNPCVMQHELRLRMRGRSVFVLMLIFVLLCSCAASAPFVLWALEHAAGSSSYTEPLTEMGRFGVLALGLVLLTLTLLALPAWAAAGIAGERERGTLGELRSTQLSASDIVIGKFAASLTYATLLLAISLPVAAWCLMLGAIAPGEVAVIYAILLSFALGIAGIGTWMSALCRRPIGAIVSTYIVLIGVFGLPVLGGALGYEAGGVTWDIFGMVIMALVWVVPAAITAWVIAAFVRWLVTRTGRMRGERARAVFAVVVFGLAMLGMAALEEGLGLLGNSDLRDSVRINPYFGLVGYLMEDDTPWATVWVSGAAAVAGCMGAARCLRLREFNPVYVEDIFVNAWRRLRARRTTRRRANAQVPSIPAEKRSS